jgi:hypothetical protein
MRLPTLLLATCVAAMVAFAAEVSSQPSPNMWSTNVTSRQNVTAVQLNLDTSRMWRRADIRVIPLEQLERNRVVLELLRGRVARTAQENSSLWLVDANLRQQLSSQVQLMKELLAFAEQQQSNQGKGPTALAVERRLNQLEGQTMCEACHSGIVAQNHGGGARAAQSAEVGIH